MHYTLGLAQIDRIEDVLQKDIMELGVTCVVLIETSGNIIAHLGTEDMQFTVYSLAALAAGNYNAVTAMSEIIGESFSLLYHKGEKESMHFAKVLDDFLLVSVFGGSVSLGNLRIKTAVAVKKIEEVLGDRADDEAQVDSAGETLQSRTLKEGTAAEAQIDSAEDAIQFWAQKELSRERLRLDGAEGAIKFWAER